MESSAFAVERARKEAAMRTAAARTNDGLMNIYLFIKAGFQIGLTVLQFHAQPGIILPRRFGIAASLRLTRGSSWIWEIALNGVSVKIQPRGFIEPWRR